MMGATSHTTVMVAKCKGRCLTLSILCMRHVEHRHNTLDNALGALYAKNEHRTRVITPRRCGSNGGVGYLRRMSIWQIQATILVPDTPRSRQITPEASHLPRLQACSNWSGTTCMQLAHGTLV